jgi:hypothetical protein
MPRPRKEYTIEDFQQKRETQLAKRNEYFKNYLKENPEKYCQFQQSKKSYYENNKARLNKIKCMNQQLKRDQQKIVNQTIILFV